MKNCPVCNSAKEIEKKMCPKCWSAFGESREVDKTETYSSFVRKRRNNIDEYAEEQEQLNRIEGQNRKILHILENFEIDLSFKQPTPGPDALIHFDIDDPPEK
jgi:Zn-finger nucleic acid-binding protein